MPRWTQNLIWAAGAITLWCPYSLCLCGGESWWACFSAAGLICITMSSAYVTWTILNKLLSKNISQYSILIKLQNLFIKDASGSESPIVDAGNRTIKALDIDDIESEIAVFAQTFHTHFVLPWYTVVSPDEKYSRQIKCALQDMLSNVIMHLQLNCNPCEVIYSFVYIYIQHYRNFMKAFEKISKDTNGNTLTDVESQELLKSYSPLHCALKSPDGINEYCKKLSHIFLVDHLPHEITHCSLLFTLIRDAFAQNVLVVFLNRFSDPRFLNDLFFQLISKDDVFGSSVTDEIIKDAQNSGDICPNMSYIHRLSLIHEESSVDLLDTELAALSRLLPETIIEEDITSEATDVAETLDTTCNSESSRKFDEMSIECALGTLISTTAAPILSKQFPFPVGHILTNSKLSLDESDLATINSTLQQEVIEDMKETSRSEIISGVEGGARHTIEISPPQSTKCLQRSSSLEDLLSSEKPKLALLQIENASKMSYSSEDLRLVSNKGKKLVKMASFDKNDGTDEQSLYASRIEKQNASKSISFKDQPHGKITDSHEYKSCNSTKSPLESGSKVKPVSEEGADLSPIYEESESLATAIAKLRSLLSEKESQTSLGSLSSFGSSESEPKSAQSDPGRYCLEKSKFNFLHKDSSGSLASIKSYSSTESCCLEDVMEAPEISFDGRIFISTSIPTTEVHTDPSDGQYTLFVIQYDAIYLCESLTSDQIASNGIGQSEAKMILQTNSVKRRFGEFLALHAALEDDSNFKVILKTIKGPNKWLNLPFSKLDSATVSSRKQFLEKYLSALIHRVELNISAQLKSFLAYNSKSSVSIMKKPLELNVPRIDKILARTVSGMFHSIKTALPTFDSIENNINCHTTTVRSADCLKTQPQEKKLIKSPLNIGSDYRLKIDITAEEEFCEMEGALLKEISSTSFKNSPIEAAYQSIETHQYADFFLARRESILAEDNRSDSYTWGSESSENFWKEMKRVVLLSSQKNARDIWPEGKYKASSEGVKLYFALSDLLVELLSKSNTVWTRDCTVKIMENLFVNDVSEILLTKVKSTFHPANLKEAMGFLTNLMEKFSIQSDSISSLTTERLSDEMTSFVKSAFPGIAKLLFNHELMETHVKLLITSFQHRMINMDLGLHCLDLIFSQFIAK